MRRIILLFPVLLIQLCCFAQTISPNENTELCPHADYSNAALGQPNVQRFTIDFGGSAASAYILVTTSTDANAPVKCKILNSLPTQGSSTTADVYIAFEDQHEVVPSFSVRNSSSKATKIFSFPYIRSLKNITPTIYSPTSTLPICSTGNISYTVTKVAMYKKAGEDITFGSQIPYYEYSVPEGWKVADITSTGQNNYILAPPGSLITYDDLHNGEIKIRATQRGYLCDATAPPTAGDWVSIPFTRPTLKLTVNGNTSLQITCGTTSPFTFTVENGDPACLSYTWDLQSDNNNWLYNGNPAPRYIPTNTNSITLTPNFCTGAPTNVSVTPKSASSTLNPLTVPVTLGIPSLNISGADLICTSQNYTIPGLPCTATVNWSLSDPSVASISVNGNDATVTNIKNGFRVTLTATISNICGANQVVSKLIKVGAPIESFNKTFTSGGATMGLDWCGDLISQYSPGKYNGYVNVDDQVSTKFTWKYLGYQGPANGTGILVPNADNKNVEIRVYPQGGNASWTLVRSNACGTFSTNFGFWANKICPEVRVATSPQNPDQSSDLSLSPNPASNQITIAIKKNTATITTPLTSNEKITGVKIYDILGRLRKNSVFNNAASVNINISDLSTGLYFVEIINGQSRVKRNLNITR